MLPPPIDVFGEDVEIERVEVAAAGVSYGIFDEVFDLSEGEAFEEVESEVGLLPFEAVFIPLMLQVQFY